MRNKFWDSSPILYILRKWIRKNKAGYMFILLPLILYTIFFLYPFVSNVKLSLTNWNGVNAQKVFIGLNNYREMMVDSMLLKSLINNGIWVIIGTIVPIVTGLILALLLWRGKLKGRIVFRTIYFMPVILSPAAIAITWRWMYQPNFGLINRVLGAIGLDFLSRGWLGDPKLALYMVLIAAIWGYTGFVVAILIAGLQNIDLELLDAARCDGANYLQTTIHVTIPQLSHILTMISVYSIIGSIKVFDIIYVMTRGGPANSTEVLGTYAYKQGFYFSNVGYGATLSIFIAFIALILSLIFMKLRKNQEV